MIGSLFDLQDVSNFTVANTNICATIRFLPSQLLPVFAFCQGKCNKILSLLFNSVNSVGPSLPQSPFAKYLSNVAILLVRMSDCFLSPFVAVGGSSTSVDSYQPICVVIKHTLMSGIVSTRTTAGRSLLPLKSVKGKVMSTISSFAIVHFF